MHDVVLVTAFSPVVSRSLQLFTRRARVFPFRKFSYATQNFFVVVIFGGVVPWSMQHGPRFLKCVCCSQSFGIFRHSRLRAFLICQHLSTGCHNNLLTSPHKLLLLHYHEKRMDKGTILFCFDCLDYFGLFEWTGIETKSPKNRILPER